MSDNRPYKLARPKALEKYILEYAIKYYGMYNSKKGEMHCTHCNKKAAVNNLKHNEVIVCPLCGEEIVIKNMRYGRKNIEENGRVLWFRKRGKITYAQLDEFDIDYTGEKPIVYFWPSAQYKFSKKECKYYKHNYWSEDTWTDRGKIVLPSATHGSAWWQNAKYERTYIYYPSLDFGSDIKYCSKEMVMQIANYIEAPYLIIGYLNAWLNQSSIEILEKSGFEELVLERICGGGCIHINWHAKNLKGVFRKFKPSQIRDLREIIKNMDRTTTVRPIEIIKHYIKILSLSGEDLSFEQTQLVRRYNEKELIDYIQTYSTIKKAAEYLERQKGESDLNDYCDYLRQCQKLDRNMTDKRVLRPKNFEEAHRKATVQLQTIKDEAINKAFEKAEIELAGKVEGFSYGGLFIKKANKVADLNKESDVLKHCVSTYANKVAEKRSAILFIRKVSEPDKPYYTLELSPKGQIVQCRGYCNQSKTKEIEDFIAQWEKYMKKAKKRKVA